MRILKIFILVLLFQCYVSDDTVVIKDDIQTGDAAIQKDTIPTGDVAEGDIVHIPNKSKDVKPVGRDHVKRRGRRDRDISPMAFYGLLLIIIVFQIGLHWWKKNYHRSYLITTLVGLICIPFYIAVRLFYWRMLLCMCMFMCTSGFLVMKAREVPLNGETPGKVYSWFLGVYRVCNALAITGYMFVVAECLGVGFAVGIDFMAFGCLLLFYGLYFGLLGRDSCEVCCDQMITTMGYTTRGGLPMRTARPGYCALCTKSLNPAKFDPGVENEPTVTLDCGHVYHESCIKGWVMVGKKDTCGVCREKVDLSKFQTSPWDKQERTWAQVLDALRYLIVWNPVMIIASNLIFSGLGVNVN